MSIDSFKFLFVDKFTKSVANNLGLLESPGSGHQSVASGSRRSGSHLSCDRHNSGSESDRDMEDVDAGSQCSSRHDQREKLVSLPRSQARASGIGQGGYAEERPRSPPVPGDQVPKGPEGQEALYSRSGKNPIEGITDKRKHKAYLEVFNALTGHPKKHDPAHVKLRETGRAIAQRMFHPPEAERWPTKEANIFHEQTSYSYS